MAALGEAGIVQLAGMLAAPGEGDNSKLEYAISGFSFYVTQPGQDQWRALAQRAYCLSLEKASSKDVKAFIISQLRIVGGDEAIAALQPYLSDERLRSEEHTSELQSLMRISYAVFCLQKTKNKISKPN